MQSILLLDDSLEDRFFACRVLKKTHPGCEVHEFSYGEDALAYIRSPNRRKLDLLLVDINIPRLNGFEFVDSYSALYSELRGTAPLFLISSSINPDDRARSEEHPAITGYLEKPLTREALLTVLEPRRSVA
ncbi:MAG: response regulator [Pseudomonadota bacterium]